MKLEVCDSLFIVCIVIHFVHNLRSIYEHAVFLFTMFINYLLANVVAVDE